MDLFSLLHNPVAIGIAVGVLSAAKVDYAAFKSWQCFHDAAVYNWRLASFRWLQGAIVGAVTGFGFDHL